MSKIFLYIQDPNALKRWTHLQGVEFKLCFDLNLLVIQNTAADALVLIHLTQDPKQPNEIEHLIQAGAKIIALSNTPSGAEGARLFKIGIKGYLNTFSDPIKIQQAIEVVQQGNVWLGQTVMSTMIQNITRQPAHSEGWKAQLTERELETAQGVLEGKSNKEIAEQMDVTERTIKAHIHHMLEKFQVKDRLGLVLKIQNWSDEPDPSASA